MIETEISSLYERSEFKNICHLVGGIYIPLDKTWKNIGISLSGGADSSLLAYILCDLIEKNQADITVHVISNIRMWKLRPWQRYNSLDVYHYLKERFSSVSFCRHENFIPPDLEWGSTGPTILDEYGEMKSGDRIEIRAHAEYIGHVYKLDAWYCGLTRNPRSMTMEDQLEDRSIDLSGDDDVDLGKMIKRYYTSFSCHPFRFLDKSWVLKTYIDLAILDLFQITRSCEGDKVQYPEVFGNLDYKTYMPNQYVPTCKQCFWCRERMWAQDMIS